jgi:hypothetical protein
MSRRQSFSAYLVIVLLMGVLLAACRAVGQPGPDSETAAVSTNTPSPTSPITAIYDHYFVYLNVKIDKAMPVEQFDRIVYAVDELLSAALADAR